MDNKINLKSYISSLIVLFALMILTYILTFVIPSGEYARIINADGNEIIDIESEFKFVEGGIPFWKWVLSPILVLTTSGSFTIIAVIILLLVIGAIFGPLTDSNIIKYLAIRANFLQNRRF